MITIPAGDGSSTTSIKLLKGYTLLDLKESHWSLSMLQSIPSAVLIDMNGRETQLALRVFQCLPIKQRQGGLVLSGKATSRPGGKSL